MLFLLFFVLICCCDFDVIILMFFVIFIIVLSCYYGLVWVMLFVLGAGVVVEHCLVMWCMGWLVFLVGLVLLGWVMGFYVFCDMTMVYFIINYVMYGFFIFLCVGYFVCDVWVW